MEGQQPELGQQGGSGQRGGHPGFVQRLRGRGKPADAAVLPRGDGVLDPRVDPVRRVDGWPAGVDGRLQGKQTGRASRGVCGAGW